MSLNPFHNKILIRSIAIFVLFALICQFSACRKERFMSGNDLALEFETDTLRFDTVFTDMGTATRKFKVYNPYNRTLQVKNIRLGGGSGSDFNLNVDGLAGTSFDNVEIPAKDSIYIFANVRVDPITEMHCEPIRLSSMLAVICNMYNSKPMDGMPFTSVRGVISPALPM